MTVYSRVLVAVLVALPALPASAERLAFVSGMERDQLVSQLFALAGEEEVRIEGILPGSSRDRYRGDVWLLDATTRQVVWQLATARCTRAGRGLLSCTDSVRLPAGEYELYVSSYRSLRFWSGDHFDLFRFVDELLRGFEDESERLVDRIQVSVVGRGRSLGENTPERVRTRLGSGAIVALAGVGDGASLRRGFELATSAELEVWALGEVTRESVFDFGWIASLATGETLWRLDYLHSEPAGGAPKNRAARTPLHLPAGRYLVAYVTDDSHSFPDFNAAPPFDPMAWGIVVRGKGRGVAARTFEVGEGVGGAVVAALTEVRNRQHRRQEFVLKQPAILRIKAVGEAYGDAMADYGWIEEASTGRKVWEMRFGDTDHAGGARKNRMVDTRISLPAGSYVVHYVSDGSHAFGSWNAAPPREPELWGITLVAVGGAAGVERPEAAAPHPATGVLARIERVGDNEHRIVPFRLEEDAEVEVRALGEGSAGRMWDTAWIEEEATGRTVWEMTYRQTEHAGGAQKNRLFLGTVFLHAGAYSLHYESDGSHSYGGWNAASPPDPEAWGATVRLAPRLPAEAPPTPRP
ncbi:MAG: hypothetical protein HXY19_01575 [Thermoanaerobaculaceae bacterium]|nr:hypothetical protein [Thermoanaerobaculaceae bacterium]